MARPPRLLLSHSFYHVMTRGNNRNKVFRSTDDYLHYLGLIHKYKKDLAFDLFHYCLMPNHTHFLIQTKQANNFSLFMKKLNLSYFYYFKKRYGWVGHFWQGRFKTQPVGKDEYFSQCGKYIELNPVRAGIVDSPEKYRFSSYNIYARGVIDNLITMDFKYEELGKTIEERKLRYHNMVVDKKVFDTYKKKSWGSDNQRYNENRKTRYHLSKIIKSETI